MHHKCGREKDTQGNQQHAAELKAVWISASYVYVYAGDCHAMLISAERPPALPAQLSSALLLMSCQDTTGPARPHPYSGLHSWIVSAHQALARYKQNLS